MLPTARVPHPVARHVPLLPVAARPSNRRRLRQAPWLVAGRGRAPPESVRSIVRKTGSDQHTLLWRIQQRRPVQAPWLRPPTAASGQTAWIGPPAAVAWRRPASHLLRLTASPTALVPLRPGAVPRRPGAVPLQLAIAPVQPVGGSLARRRSLC